MRKALLSLAIMGCLFVFVQCSAAEPACTYGLDSSAAQVEWTAFKTTAKVPVKGQFTKLTVNSPDLAPSLEALLTALEFTIDTTSVSTGDVARDGVISAFFFQQMVGNPEIKGGIEKVDGENSGTAQVRIFMNSETNLIPMTYKVDANHQLTATGQLNILDFGAGQALESLHTACKEKHTGDDGVSKTWSEVELKISAPLKKECSS